MESNQDLPFPVGETGEAEFQYLGSPISYNYKFPK